MPLLRAAEIRTPHKARAEQKLRPNYIAQLGHAAAQSPLARSARLCPLNRVLNRPTSTPPARRLPIPAWSGSPCAFGGRLGPEWASSFSALSCPRPKSTVLAVDSGGEPWPTGRQQLCF